MRKAWSISRSLLMSCCLAGLSGCDADFGGESGESPPIAVEPIGDEETGVIRVLSHKTGRATDEISSRQTMEQLGLDDLGLIAVLAALENRYDITIHDESVEIATGTRGERRPATPHLTVARLVSLVKRARGAP